MSEQDKQGRIAAETRLMVADTQIDNLREDYAKLYRAFSRFIRIEMANATDTDPDVLSEETISMMIEDFVEAWGTP